MIKRIAGFSIVFIVALAAFGGMNYYVYLNIARGFQLTGGGLAVLRVLFVFLTLSYPISQFMRRIRPLPLLYHLGALWMGILSISIAVFLVKDLGSMLLPQRENLEQLAMGVIFVLTIFSVGKAYSGPILKTVRIANSKLKTPLNIVHLSDLHLNVMTSPKWLERVIDQVNKLEADIIVITGDMVDDTFSNVGKLAPAMRRLDAKMGIYAVTGNHENYMGLDHFRKFCDSADIMVADNKLVAVTDNINMLGLDDKMVKAGGSIEETTRDLLASGNGDSYNIMLIHQPVGFQKAAKLGIDLQLSGHTHKGQVLPFNFFINFFYRYSYGLYTLGNSHIYTSSGTGTWGPPMRLGSNSEIVRIQVN